MEEGKKEKRYSSQKWKEFLEEAQRRCASDESDYSYKHKFLEFMRNYEREHKEELQEYLEYYNEATSKSFFEESYLLLDRKK